MKKMTDKERLDWLALASWQDWILLWQTTGISFLKPWIAGWQKALRSSIDAAIRAERRKEGKE